MTALLFVIQAKRNFEQGKMKTEDNKQDQR